MKIVTGALAAALLAGIGWSPSAYAQGVPQGSYLRSCTNAGVESDTLVATCRRVDGREQRSALAGVRRCVGDIGNDNGILQCGLAGGRQQRGQVVAGPGPGPRPEPGPGYAPPPGGPPSYGATPAYGAPPPGWQRERWERCHELHERREEVRARLDREYDPADRARLEGRLHELREQEERCR